MQRRALLRRIQVDEASPHQYFLRSNKMSYEPSLKAVHAFLDPETCKAISFPLAALITGALLQVETTIELANRVCDSVIHRSSQTPLTRG